MYCTLCARCCAPPFPATGCSKLSRDNASGITDCHTTEVIISGTLSSKVPYNLHTKYQRKTIDKKATGEERTGRQTSITAYFTYNRTVCNGNRNN